jgi:hypothetical protein
LLDYLAAVRENRALRGDVGCVRRQLRRMPILPRVCRRVVTPKRESRSRVRASTVRRNSRCGRGNAVEARSFLAAIESRSRRRTLHPTSIVCTREGAERPCHRVALREGRVPHDQPAAQERRQHSRESGRALPVLPLDASCPETTLARARRRNWQDRLALAKRAQSQGSDQRPTATIA